MDDIIYCSFIEFRMSLRTARKLINNLKKTEKCIHKLHQILVISLCIFTMFLLVHVCFSALAVAYYYGMEESMDKLKVFKNMILYSPGILKVCFHIVYCCKNISIKKHNVEINTVWNIISI